MSTLQRALEIVVRLHADQQQKDSAETGNFQSP